jgi:hypothetical protein
MKNLAEIILFAMMVLPYIGIMLSFFKKIYQRAVTVADKLKYLAMFLGAATMLPDFLIKVDYGRWVLSVVCYYLLIILCLATQDRIVREELHDCIVGIREKSLFWKLLLIYPVLMVPFYDVNINQITAIIGHVLNREWLHWW